MWIVFKWTNCFPDNKLITRTLISSTLLLQILLSNYEQCYLYHLMKERIGDQRKRCSQWSLERKGDAGGRSNDPSSRKIGILIDGGVEWALWKSMCDNSSKESRALRMREADFNFFPRIDPASPYFFVLLRRMLHLTFQISVSQSCWEPLMAEVIACYHGFLCNEILRVNGHYSICNRMCLCYCNPVSN